MKIRLDWIKSFRFCIESLCVCTLATIDYSWQKNSVIYNFYSLGPDS